LRCRDGAGTFGRPIRRVVIGFARGAIGLVIRGGGPDRGKQVQLTEA
jgi:hypothetical protein